MKMTQLEANAMKSKLKYHEDMIQPETCCMMKHWMLLLIDNDPSIPGALGACRCL